MKKLMIILVLCLVVVVNFGCSGGVTVTAGGEAYYPNIKTAKGGSFNDPGGRGKSPAFASGSASSETTASGFGRWRK